MRRSLGSTSPVLPAPPALAARAPRGSVPAPSPSAPSRAPWRPCAPSPWRCVPRSLASALPPSRHDGCAPPPLSQLAPSPRAWLAPQPPPLPLSCAWPDGVCARERARVSSRHTGAPVVLTLARYQVLCPHACQVLLFTSRLDFGLQGTLQRLHTVLGLGH